MCACSGWFLFVSSAEELERENGVFLVEHLWGG